MAAVLLFWHTNIAAVKSSLNVFKKLYWAVRYIACLADESKTLVKSVHEKAPKSLFWALHLCTQIWVRAMIALSKKQKTKTKTKKQKQKQNKKTKQNKKKHRRFANQVERNFLNASPGIRWVFLFVKYISLQYTVQWNKQTKKQTKWQRVVDAHDKDF